MPETNESPARTITLGIFYVIVGDILFGVLLTALNVLIAMKWSSSFFLFIAAYNTAIVGWVWVVPVVLWIRHKRPLLARVMLFTSAVLTLLDAACWGVFSQLRF